MSREQKVRDAAYAIWEAEGRPEGRDADHWRLAEERVTFDAKTSKSRSGPARTAPKGGEKKPPAKPGKKIAPAQRSTGKTSGAGKTG